MRLVTLGLWACRQMLVASQRFWSAVLQARGGFADETKVPSWFTRVPIRAQVEAPLFPGAPFEPWGPVIDLHPVFLAAGRPLWGQEDLYASFRIIAERYIKPEIAAADFELEYWANMSDGVPRP